ncbi:MAG: hypothetical protein ACRDZ1_00025 [Acidimicrobiia bacterium]
MATDDPREEAPPEDGPWEAEDAGLTIRPIYADDLDDYLDTLEREGHCPRD